MTLQKSTLKTWLKLFADNDDAERGLSDLELDALIASEMQFEDFDDDVKASFAADESSKNRLAVLREEQAALSPLVERLLKNAQQELAADLANAAKKVEHDDVSASGSRSWFQTLQASWARLALYGTPLAAGVALVFYVAQTPRQDAVLDPVLDVDSAQNESNANAHARLPNAVRAKGSALSFFIKRGEKIQRGHSGDKVSAGDALRFVRTNGQDSHFLLFSVDAKGNLSALAPFDALKSKAVKAGIEVPLEGSLVLDDDEELERIIGLYSDEAFSLEQLRSVMNAHLAKGVAPGSAIGEAVLRERLSEEKLRSMPWPGVAHVVTLVKKSSTDSTKNKNTIENEKERK